MDHTTVSRQRWQDHWLFLTHFRKSPRTVGAIAPSSRRLARAMLDGLPIEPGSAVRRCRAGPGNRRRHGRDRQPAAGRCDLPGHRRRSRVQRARRGALAAASTRSAIGPSVWSRSPAPATSCPIDHIVSGLPFASLPAASARAIVEAIVSSLRVGGTFTTFQYVHAYGFSSAMAVRRDPDAGNGLCAHTITRRRQPAPGIGAPLA